MKFKRMIIKLKEKIKPIYEEAIIKKKFDLFL